MLNKLFFFPSYQNNKIPNIYKLTIYSTLYLMKRKIKLEQHVKKQQQFVQLAQIN